MGYREEFKGGNRFVSAWELLRVNDALPKPDTKPAEAVAAETEPPTGMIQRARQFGHTMAAKLVGPVQAN